MVTLLQMTGLALGVPLHHGVYIHMDMLHVTYHIWYLATAITWHTASSLGHPGRQQLRASHHIHHATSHHTTSRHITPHHITPHHATSHHITSHHIMPHHITSRHITPHHIAPHHATSHRATSHPSTLSSCRFTCGVFHTHGHHAHPALDHRPHQLPGHPSPSTCPRTHTPTHSRPHTHAQTQMLGHSLPPAPYCTQRQVRDRSAP